MDTAIVEMKNGVIAMKEVERGSKDLAEMRERYEHIASAWDYSARVWNPIIYYFRER